MKAMIKKIVFWGIALFFCATLSFFQTENIDLPLVSPAIKILDTSHAGTPTDNTNTKFTDSYDAQTCTINILINKSIML